uniref:Uncharacterized protein n=1 Tax=Octopus bimaculoides TaxID=37653 RepID=A0A0L8HUK2_OCTBM
MRTQITFLHKSNTICSCSNCVLVGIFAMSRNNVNPRTFFEQFEPTFASFKFLLFSKLFVNRISSFANK